VDQDAEVHNEVSQSTVGFLVQAGVVHGGVHLHQSVAAQEPRPLRSPAELPGDIPDFTGRDQIAAEVRQLLDHAGGTESTAVVISAITGMAGIGKTALAVHIAHQERERFPDGQFYVNLRGAEAQALDPMMVLGSFLTELGMVDLPGDLGGRARAYRTRVAGRRMLVVLDNAANADQVRPLLPGSPSCAVLITSRVRLLNLAGARMVLLDVLRTDEAVELLSRMSGHERAAAERDPANEIVRLCGHLPIAIRMAGAVLIKRPRQSLARLAEQLRQERPLDVFSAEGSDDVRVSFSLSYRNLGPDEQLLFRLLGLLRAPDFPAWVGEVALGTVPDRGTRAVIDRLVDAQLLEDDHGQGDVAGQCRYHFHDLLREFARERLEASESAATRHQVMRHVFTRYLLLSQAASRLLRPVDDDTPQPVHDSEPSSRSPLEWFLAEHVGLTAAVEQAGESGFGTLAWKLALSLEAFFERCAQWDSWLHVCESALAAAREAADREGEAQMLRSLGYLARERGRPREALDFLGRGRDGFRAIDDRFGEARALCNMIRTYRDLGRFDDALECYRSALPMARSCGSRWLEASVHRDMGMAYRDHGNADQALDCFEKVLPLFRETGEELLETYTVRDIGLVYQQLDRPADSEPCFQRSLVGFERMGDRRGAARALNSLGVSHRAAHKWDDSATCFRRALEIFRDIGDRRWEAYTLRSLGELSHDQAVAVGQHGLPITRRARRRSQLRDAEDMLRESRRILDELDDRPWEAQTLLSLGEVYCDQGRWDDAITCFTQCLAVFRATGNSKGQADARTRLDRAISLRDQNTGSPKGVPDER
jgi:tetratricopeptide (TPR) repeat protein